MASLFGGSKSTPKVIAYDDPAMQSQIPEDAWIITVWLREIRGLVPGMSGDIGGFADPYVNFKFSKCNNGMFNDQTQTSSFRRRTLNPLWLPPERFMFVIDPSLSTEVKWPKKGSWPQLLCEVMDYDDLSKDDGMGNASYDLSSLLAVKGGGPYTSDGEEVVLPLHHPDTNDKMKGAQIVLRIAAGLKSDVLEVKEDRIVEYMRWTPAQGWAPPTGPADPRRFAVASGTYGIYEVDPLKSMRNAGSTISMGMTAAFGLTKRNSSSFSSPPTSPSGGDEASHASTSSAASVAATGIANQHVFSDPDFDTVASLLARSQQLARNDSSSSLSTSEQGDASVKVTHQWSVMNTYGESDGWQYAFNFTRKNTDWSPNLKKTSFCRRRFWERRTKIVRKKTEGKTAASSESDDSMQVPLRVGWLCKKGELNVALRERYFVLWPRALVYYKSEPPNYNIMEHAPTGVIALRGAEVIRKTKTVFDIHVKSTNRTFSLTAGSKQGSAENMEVWANAVEETVKGNFAAVRDMKTVIVVDSRMRAEKIEESDDLNAEFERLTTIDFDRKDAETEDTPQEEGAAP